MDKAKRQSNIELLRIMTMCGVIVLHYNNATIGGGLAYAQGINLVILYYLESLFACAVNLFVLISGYFMYTKQKRTLDKPFELLVQVILFGEIFYLLLLLVQHEPFKINDFLKRLIPSNWFVILYITIYFVSPFLNLAIQKIKEDGLLTKFMVILILLFSIYPTCVDALGEITRKEYVGLSSIGMYGSQLGYSIINFSLMYIIGAYLRKNPDTDSNIKHIARILMVAAILTVWAFINDRTGFSTERSAWEYCNPLVIYMAVEIFRLFSNIDIGQKRFINRFAEASFTVYLLHNKFLKFLRIPQFVLKMPIIMLLHILISVLLIYTVCVVIYYAYSKSIPPILNSLYNKFPVFKKGILENEWR